MPLEVHLVAGLPVGLAPEEMVEADLVQAGGAGVGGQVAADPLGRVVGPHHHDGGVPADVGPDPALDVLVAGEPRLLVRGDGVDVRRGDGGGEAHLVLPGPLEQLHQEEASPGLAAGVEDGVEGVDPLGRLLRIDVGELVRETVEDHVSIVALIYGKTVQDFGRLALTTETTEPGRRWQRWESRYPHAVVLVGVVALAKADAATIGVVAPALRADLHVTDAELGLLAALSSITGALCALPAGGLVDRRHRPLLIGGAVALWSLALGFAGLATGLLLLAVARLVSGAVATVARPATVSLAGDLYHPHQRGRALAALDAGQAAGTGVCFILGALAVHFLSWRWLFFGLAAGGLALALGTRTVDEPAPTRPPGPNLGKVLRVLVEIRTNRLVLASDSVGNFFYAGVASFSVLFITERYGLTMATVDALAPVLAVGVIAGIIAGGRLGDRLTRSVGGSTRLVVASGCQLVATVFFGAALVSSSIVPAAVLLFFGASVLGGAAPCLDAVRLDIVRPSIRGRAEAAKGLLTLASSALGPITFGLVATALTGAGRSHAMALRDTFLMMLIPLAAGALILLVARSCYPADAAAAATAAAQERGVPH